MGVVSTFGFSVGNVDGVASVADAWDKLQTSPSNVGVWQIMVEDTEL